MTATSQNDPSVDDDLSITTQVRVHYGLEFSSTTNSVSGEPGATVSFNFKLVNKWSDSINYEIHYINQIPNYSNLSGFVGEKS